MLGFSFHMITYAMGVYILRETDSVAVTKNTKNTFTKTFLAC